MTVQKPLGSNYRVDGESLNALIDTWNKPSGRERMVRSVSTESDQWSETGSMPSLAAQESIAEESSGEYALLMSPISKEITVTNLPHSSPLKTQRHLVSKAVQKTARIDSAEDASRLTRFQSLNLSCCTH